MDIPTGVVSISIFKKSHELGVEPCAVELPYIPVVTEYLAAVLIEPFALANMKIGGTSPDGEVLYSVIFAESIGSDLLCLFCQVKNFERRFECKRLYLRKKLVGSLLVLDDCSEAHSLQLKFCSYIPNRGLEITNH